MDFEEFVTLLGPKLSTSGIPEKFHGTDFDTVFWKVYPGNWVSARWRCHGACEWLDPRHSEGGREGRVTTVPCVLFPGGLGSEGME